jgi:acetyltransferase
LFRNPEDPAKVISNTLFYSQRKNPGKYLTSRTSKIDLGDSFGFIDHVHIKILCDAYDIPLVSSLVVKKNAIIKCEPLNYPLVLKGLSKNVVHKSELNAVKLNLKNHEELIQAELEILSSFQENNIDLEEFQIQPFISTKHELLIGGFRDSSFGPMIMFGSGGKYVEVFQDTCIKSAYMTYVDADEFIAQTKIGRILKGVRGEKPVNLAGLRKIILSSAQIMLDNPNIMEFDFNPLVVDKDNSLYVVDVRVKNQPELSN